MRISDWSSDVCSSDLVGSRAGQFRHPRTRRDARFRAPTRRLHFMRQQQDGNPPPREISVKPRAPCAAPDSQRILGGVLGAQRSEEHTSELQSLMRISYAVFCLKKKKKTNN